MASLRAQLTSDPASPSSDAKAAPGAPYDAPEIRTAGGSSILIVAVVLAIFWAGAASAFMWGYYRVEGSAGLFQLEPQVLALAAVAVGLPPLLFLAGAFALIRAQIMTQTAARLAFISDRLTSADENAIQTSQRLGRAVRRELDALSAGFDSAFGRLRALETALADRVAQLEDASARAGVKAENIAQRLHAERDGIEELTGRLDEAAARAAEMLAGRSAQLKTMIESAGGELKAAGQTLDAQAAQFREAVEKAAATPQDTALALGRQAQQIEAVADATVQRAELVLARQERQRAAMTEMLDRLRDEGNTFEAALEAQRAAAEKTVTSLASEAQALDAAAERSLRRMDTAMAGAAARSTDLAAGFGADADRVQETADRAATAIANLVESLKEAAARTFENAREAERLTSEKAAALLAGGTAELDALASQGLRALDAAMREAQAHGTELVKNFDEDAAHVKTAAQDAAVSIAGMIATMREAASRVAESAAEAERAAAEKAAAALTGNVQRLDEIAEQNLRRIDAAMAEAAARSTELAAHFGQDVARVKETAEAAEASIARLVESLREGAANTQALISESTSDAKRSSKEFVGEAMDQCDQLLRAAKSVAEEAENARAQLAKAAEEAERHIVALPGVAAQEAARVRETLRRETEDMLDISARALASLQSRNHRRNADADAAALAAPAGPETGQAEGVGESLRGLARRITGGKRRPEDRPKGNFELSQVLAAADGKDASKSQLRPGAASALAALQAALADLAGDLDALAGDTADPALWRRYLDGDRGVFARRLASSIGPDSVERIAALYRDNSRFHDYAEAYLEDFEAMLTRAREGDRDGFLASTLLSADTGKIYLAIAYALGRLE